ncbi:MAG: tryptophan-rich sensory protein [Cyanothece sp. SIO2G6]|nr:tryptophan-rich sensory protein [Cyanothece sp. SIO2G6]
MASDSSSSSVDYIQAIATCIAIVGTFGVNSLSNFYPPGGQNVGEISNTVFKNVQIIPANYAFIIWGIIYVGLIAYGIYQFQPSQRQDSRIRQTSRYLIIACVIQIGWIYLFTLKLFWLSVAAMLGILASLSLAYQSLDIGRGAVTRWRRWLAHVPFSIYLAWISVATIVNVASALFYTGLRTSGTSWTVAMLLVGGGLAAIIIQRYRDTAFALVFVWAYGAIAVSQRTNLAIVITSLGVAVALIFHLVLTHYLCSHPSQSS